MALFRRRPSPARPTDNRWRDSLRGTNFQRFIRDL